MDKEKLRWAAAFVFAVLAVLQAAKWGVMGMAVQGPLVLILVLGLVVAGFRESLPFRNHGLFICAYAAVFLLLWGVGHPAVEIEIGRTWIATVIGLGVLAGVLVWNLRDRQGFWWLVALVLATGFGLFIAYASGPQGSTPWMFDFYMKLFGFREDEWQKGLQCVHYTRKSLHFLGYGATAYATAYIAMKSSGNLRRSLAFGVLWPLPIAMFDEWQQRFSPQYRTGKVSDVLLDFAGMVFFLSLFWWGQRRKIKRTNEE